MKSPSTGSSAGATGAGGEHPGSGASWLEALGSLRLSIVLMSVLMALCALGTWIAQQEGAEVSLERLYSPETLYFMKMAGLTNLFGSGWFISVLGLFALNLACAVAAHWAPAWKAAATAVPHAINLQQALASRSQERFVHVDFKSEIGREQFRELVRAWSLTRTGRVHAVRDQGGLNELQLVTQTGRFSKLSLYLAHLAVLLILGGALAGWLGGFEGRLDLDEGARVPYLQITRGANRDWPIFQGFGRVFPGFYEPGFEIQASRFDLVRYPLSDHVRALRTELEFYRGGKLAKAARIEVNSPTSFDGIRFVQAGYENSGRLRAAIRVRDRLAAPHPGEAPTEPEQDFARVITGMRYPLESGSFRMIQAEPGNGDRGPAARIEYQPEQGAPESFWVFQRFPRFDEVHRKASRYVFTLEELMPSYTSSIYVEHDPGRPWVWAGACLLVLCLAYSLLFSHDRYWFAWKPGRVIVVGSSSKFLLFAPRFEAAMERFRARVEKAAEKGK